MVYFNLNNNMIPLKPFYFMRHGQTAWNKEHRCMGLTDIPLNSLGYEQARNSLEVLKGIKLDRIVTSPLLRASCTAEIISNHYTLPVEKNAYFQEATWGELEGKKIPNENDFINWRHSITPLKAESFEDVKKRVAAGMKSILSINSIPLIISHGGVYWALLDLLNLPFRDIGNCEVMYFLPSQSNSGPWLSTSLLD